MKKILIISPEVYPQIKVGGLGKMVAGVVKALREKEVDVRVISPGENIYRPLWQEKTKLVYQQLGWRARNYCQENDWQPDWLWIHDWGGVWSAERFLGGADWQPKVIWTIHSPVGDEYTYQYGYGYGYDYWSGEDDEPIDWGDSFFDFSALVDQGISLADRVTTVSTGFARRLSRHPLFQRAREIVGIANAIDQDEWNPRIDPLVGFKLGSSWLEFKQRNKQTLQHQFGLPQEEVPVFCFVSRIVPQKGVRLLTQAMRQFLAKNQVQFVVVGSGRESLLQYFKRLKSEFPRKVGLRLEADFDLPHQVFAGSDFLVLPSKTEPFGIVVAEARKYGVVPIVHLVDGLKDQVQDGVNGLGFNRYQTEALLEKLYQAYQSWQLNWWQWRWDWLSAQVEAWVQIRESWLRLMEN